MVRHSCFGQLLNRKANPEHPPACTAQSSKVPLPNIPPESSLMLTGVPVK